MNTKIYKGDLTTVEQLTKSFNGAIPIQSINGPMLPDMFIVTKLQPALWGDRVTLHYVHPKSGVRSYRDVPKDLQLNILTGTRGTALRQEWKTMRTSKLGEFGRRLTCSLGTDPEIFAVKAGEVVPAWSYLPGKDKPKTFKFNNRTGTAYWDGFQAEFTTQGTDTCLLWVSDNIQAGLKAIHDAAKQAGAKLTIDTVLPVNPDILQTEPQEHVQFGCAPSFNAYGLQGNIADGRDVPFRFAGGHLHFGIDTLTKVPGAREAMIQKYVKALDMLLAVATVSLLGELDNPIRRKFYGLPGEYRMPSHGFEYRVLSNAWLCHPLAMNMVFDLARSVCGLAEEGFLDEWQSSHEEMLDIVINNDITKARVVLTRNEAMFKQICKVITGPYYTSAACLDLAFKVWSTGLSNYLKSPRDVVGNWNLDGGWVCHGDGPGKNWYKGYDMLARGEKV